MRRTPLVLASTVAGLVAVLAFHTTAAVLGSGTLPGVTGAAQTLSGSQPSTAASGSGSPPSPRPSSRPHPGGTRTATGPAVNYNYGTLSVSVTVSGSRITKVGIASIDDGGLPRSQDIDQQAIPVLEQETLQAQSANIQGVSGASYTSAGFQQSLQAALHSLGFQ
jgi:uncharacterized protein with FMN-binding domain